MRLAMGLKKNLIPRRQWFRFGSCNFPYAPRQDNKKEKNYSNILRQFEDRPTVAQSHVGFKKSNPLE
jgi:hypothetical protein